MLKKPQSQLKQTSITSLPTMNDTLPSLLLT